MFYKQHSTVMHYNKEIMDLEYDLSILIQIAAVSLEFLDSVGKEM